MYSITELVQYYDIFSTNLIADTVYEELEAIEADGRENDIRVILISFDSIVITGDMIVDRILLEFIMYLIHIDEIVPDLEDMYKDYITRNNLYDELIGFYPFLFQYKEEVNKILKAHTHTLMFLGWYNRGRDNRQSAGFLTGYDDGK